MRIVVASGKGGTGKTTVATSLALIAGESVRFVDCDVEAPNAALFLNPSLDKRKEVGILLPVVDDFDRTMDAMDKTEDVKAFTEGVKLVQQKFLNVLQKQGMAHFETKGEAFDPELHEAITKIPAPSDDLKGKVVDVIEKGYMLNEKVLRYAKVVVGE